MAHPLPLVILVLAGVDFTFDEPAIDRGQLIQLIEGARAAREYKDVAFEFEGKKLLMRERERASQGLPDGVTASYTGTYARRADGATRADVYFFDHFSRNASHYIVATLGPKTTVWGKAGDAEEAKVTVKEAEGDDFLRSGCFGQVLEIDQVLDFARSNYPYEFVGFEDLDGVRCAVARFYRATDLSQKEKALTETYWIDLERGGYVLRHEHRWGPDLARLTTKIRLESFDAPSGRPVWLPVYGQQEGHVSIDVKDPSKTLFPEDPVYVESYELVPATIRFDQGLDDDDFTIKPRNGDHVSDRLKQADYEYGQYMVQSKAEAAKPPPTDAEIEQNLEAMLNDADVLDRELKASSVARRGTTWTDRAPWLVTGGAVAALAILLIRRRMAD